MFPKLVPLLLALSAPLGAAADAIEWVAVGDPGHACDARAGGCHGAVAEPYRIARTETTNAQYAAFLNAVAASDPHALYNPEMGGPEGGIARSGAPGGYAYRALAGREQRPVNFVSFWDALRFANWLHNGRPRGPQDGTTTEDGAYTLSADGFATEGVVRNAAARVFLPSENEWYKAAYYDPASRSWLAYPAGSDARTTCAAPGPAPNTANCGNAVGDLTDVGSYPASASPSGTFDQGGNVFEWYEPRRAHQAGGLRGGSFHRSATVLGAANRQHAHAPATERRSLGFRVASQLPPGEPL